MCLKIGKKKTGEFETVTFFGFDIIYSMFRVLCVQIEKNEIERRVSRVKGVRAHIIRANSNMETFSVLKYCIVLRWYCNIKTAILLHFMQCLHISLSLYLTIFNGNIYIAQHNDIYLWIVFHGSIPGNNWNKIEFRGFVLHN